MTVSAAAAGMIGAYAKTIIGGTILSEGIFTLAGVGEPLGAFVAAYLAVEIGGLVAGKTKVDILVTPITTITVGSVVGLSIGVPIAAFMTKVGELINWGAVQQPFWAGIIVSVLMGIALTLPISSAAIGVSLNLSGIAAGAAAVGCAANMVGFAVASFRENKNRRAGGAGAGHLHAPDAKHHPQARDLASRHSGQRHPGADFHLRTRHDQQCHRKRYGDLRPCWTDHGVPDHDR